MKWMLKVHAFCAICLSTISFETLALAYIPPCHFLSGSNVALRWKAKGRQIPKLGPEEEGDWQGPFFFVLGADTQLGLIDQMNNVTVNPSQ